MLFIKRLLRCIPLLLLANAVWLCGAVGLWGIFLLLPAVAGTLAVHLKPAPTEPFATRRLRILQGGYELLYLFALCFLLECGFWGLTFTLKSITFWMNALVSILALFLLLMNGLLRIFFSSSQVGILWRILLLLFWWLPGFNFWLIWKACSTARREYRFELAHLERTAIQASSGRCRTRYPLLMVHGIFFRDWQLLDYWGRIPGALQANGAKVFYGRQQSADAVSRSAQELCEQIIHIIESEGCEKVNIIAHSKGGLDARFAISHYGMDRYVASLTTVNTPHRGCNFVDLLLRILPGGLLHFLAGRYNALFRKLGDISPDFEKGVRDLTAARCADFNRETPDCPGVYYQSVMSKLQSAFGTIFPLCFSALLIRRLDGENDGLVSTASAVWGNFRGVISTPYRKGISHGDVIDLLRENLKGFDIREYYVQLVEDLKNRGF